LSGYQPCHNSIQKPPPSWLGSCHGTRHTKHEATTGRQAGKAALAHSSISRPAIAKAPLACYCPLHYTSAYKHAGGRSDAEATILAQYAGLCISRLTSRKLALLDGAGRTLQTRLHAGRMLRHGWTRPRLHGLVAVTGSGCGCGGRRALHGRMGSKYKSRVVSLKSR